MRILGIETSGPAGQVALADDDCVLEAVTLDAQQRHAQQLIPAIGRLLAQQGWPPGSLELICLSIGPGSYTGLRVGLTAAKTLCYATGAKLIAVGTLDVIAAGARAEATRISVASDAGRSELYTADFRRDAAGSLQPTRPVEITAAAHWAARLQPGTLVLGPGLRLYLSAVPAHCTVADESLWDPQARLVIALGLRDFRAGRRDDFWFLEPLYLRKSAAEEKRESRGEAGRS